MIVQFLARIKGKIMEYLSLRQTAEKWGVSVRRIQVLCAEERIPGAIKIGSYGDFPLGEYKHCVVRTEYLVLQRLVHIGRFRLMRKNQRMKG